MHPILSRPSWLALYLGAWVPVAALFEYLHHRADADGGEKSDDENRNGAAQQRLGAHQPPIGGLGNRLRKSLD